MYILREQGALVTINQTMLHKFVSTITKHCPEECESQFFEPEVTADAVIDDNTAQLFGAFRYVYIYHSLCMYILHFKTKRLRDSTFSRSNFAAEK